MRVAILGSGLMGGKLGTIFARAGHEAVFSYARSEVKLKKLTRDAGRNARAGTPREAAQDADAILLAVHWSRIDDVLNQAGDLSGKIIVSCSLPMNADDTDLVVAHTSSGSEALAKNVSGAQAGPLRIARYAEPFALLIGQLAYEGSGGSELAYRFEQFGRERMDIKRSGSQPSVKGPAENFTGSVRIDPLIQASDPARVLAVSVTFEPGARTAWHIHPLGQTLIVTAGCGLVQSWGGPVQKIRPGDVVWCPPREKHWHGATATTAMTHIAIVEQMDGKTVDWMEKVSDEQSSAGSTAEQ